MAATFLGAEATDQVEAHVHDGPRHRSTFNSIDECLCGPLSDGYAISTYRRQWWGRICRQRQVAKAKDCKFFWHPQAATVASIKTPMACLFKQPCKQKDLVLVVVATVSGSFNIPEMGWCET